MSGPRDYADYVADMLESAQKAREFVADEKTQYAVVRALEVLGEAAKKVPQEDEGIEWHSPKSCARRRLGRQRRAADAIVGFIAIYGGDEK